MERPIFFSLVILIAAYLPLFTLERVERRLFTPMAFTVCSALIGSLICALTLIPVLATFLFRKGPRWRNPIMTWLTNGYEWTLRRLLRVPIMVAVSAVVIIALALALGTRLGTEFLPQLDEGVIWVRANLPPGTSLEKSARVAADMRALIRNTRKLLVEFAVRPQRFGNGSIRPEPK